ncbi:hypothetical protein BH20ACI1_BH20ACI1_16240 [soil metagenome]
MNIKNTITFLFAAVVLVLAGSIETNAQSAKMKSLMGEIKDTFPKYEKIITDNCDGAKVKYEVDFASFGDDYDALLRVPSMGLNESSYGIQRFCYYTNDNIGKDAVKSKIKTVRLKNITDKGGKKITLLKDGTLLLEMAFHYYDAGLSNVEVQRILGDIL